MKGANPQRDKPEHESPVPNTQSTIPNTRSPIHGSNIASNVDCSRRLLTLSSGLAFAPSICKTHCVPCATATTTTAAAAAAAATTATATTTN